MLFADLNLARRLELADAAKHIAYAEARAKLLGTDCCRGSGSAAVMPSSPGRTTHTVASWGWGWMGR